ncbi:MAG: FG-GAP repeat protein, partial [Thermoplasmatales archaeon]
MKKKMLGIFVCMLLIATAIPAVGTIVNDNLTMRETSDDYNNLLQQIIGSSCSLGGWGELDKLTASDGTTDDGFGYSVSIDGEYALIGASGDDDNGESSGSAYVFKRTGTTWSEEDKLAASDGALGDVFGWSVSIDGDYALEGAFLDDDNGETSGSAYVFKRSCTTWSEEDKLTASDGALGDYCGR